MQDLKIEDSIICLIFGGRTEAKAELLESIISNYNSVELKSKLSKINEKFVLNYTFKLEDQTDKMLILINLSESDDIRIAKKAMSLLQRELNNIEDIVDKRYLVKIAKYIAIHAEKKYSKKAFDILSCHLNDISELKNPELKASTLRYLATHSTPEIRREAYRIIEESSDKFVRENSIDYLKEKYSESN